MVATQDQRITDGLGLATSEPGDVRCTPDEPYGWCRPSCSGHFQSNAISYPGPKHPFNYWCITITYCHSLSRFGQTLQRSEFIRSGVARPGIDLTHFWPNLMPYDLVWWKHLAMSWAGVARTGTYLEISDTLWPNLAQVWHQDLLAWPTPAQMWYHLTRCGQTWHRSTKIWPGLA